MKRKKTYPENFATLALPILLILVLFPACDCGSSDENSDNANPLDDDSGNDNDTSADDDADDDSSTTTTSVPTTTTSTVVTTSTTSSTSGSTTTAPTSTSTTTTTQPGDGSACDPYVFEPEEIIPEVPYGPWPEFEIDGVVFQQIVASTAGEGRNDILVAPDGHVNIVGQEGVSLDVWTIDPSSGDSTRETIDHFGGETKNMDIDAEGSLHVLYTYRPKSGLDVRELRYATNESGDWETVTLLENDGGEYPEFDMALDQDTGVIHLVYNQFERDDENVHYATWDHGVWTTEILATPTTFSGWLNIALDGAGAPHVTYYDDEGMEYWRKTGSDWGHELAHDAMAPWDLIVDDEGTVRVAGDGDADLALYSGFRTDDGWVFDLVDDCMDQLSSVTMNRDSSGTLHFVYSDRLGHNVKYATDQSGDWVFTQVGTSVLRNARNMVSTVDESGNIHVVHRQHSDTPRALYYDTNAGGTWKRYGIAANHSIPTDRSAMDADGNIHFFSPSDDYTRVLHGVFGNGTWTQELLDENPMQYSFSAARDIAIDSSGKIHAVWGSDDEGYLRYAEKSDSGWTFQDLISEMAYFSDIHISTDVDDAPHIAFAGSDGTAESAHYLKKSMQSWSTETIPGTAWVSDFVVDTSGNPVSISPGEIAEEVGTVVSRRVSSGVWDRELVNPEYSFGLYAVISVSDSIYLLTDGSNELFLSSNELADWNTDTLPLGGSSSEVGQSMIVDNLEIVHVVGYESQIPGQPIAFREGLIYMNNQSGVWKWANLLSHATYPTPFSLYMNFDGKLVVVFGVAKATMTAKFDPDIVP